MDLYSAFIELPYTQGAQDEDESYSCKKNNVTHTHSAFDGQFSGNLSIPLVLGHLCLGDRKGIRPVQSWMLVCWR